ncbi:MAG: zinc-binding alcohol dehydrogenase family protein [Gaiella sp.]|nr:zinc-binding alcohol dehydrogenase family protein [Gaiella sp.]
MPQTATALRVHAFGEAPRPEQVPVPHPGEGEVLLRMVAAAVGHHDLGVVAGTLPHQPPPFTPGLEGAGVVVALGEGVDDGGLAVGALVRVVTRGQANGTWAEYVAAPARALVPVPAGLEPTVAAACGTVAVAAWAALERAGLEAGGSIGVTGASGAVGSLAVQLARQRGAARVVAWTRSREALPEGVEVAADEGPAEPVDALVDTVGGELLPRRLHAVRPGGRAVLVGYTAGERVCFELPELMVVDVSLVPLNMMRFRVPREVAVGLLDDFAAGRLALATDVVGIDTLDAAVERLRSGRATGRVVLRW